MKYISPEHEHPDMESKSWKALYLDLEKKFLETQIQLGKARGLAKHYEIVIDDLKAEINLLQQNVKY